MNFNLKSLAIAAAAAGAIALTGATSAQALNVGTLSTPVGSGSMTLTANAGSSRLVVNGSVPLNCTATSAQATINTGVFALPATIGVVQPIFTGCTGPSGFAFNVSCTETGSLVVTGGGPSVWNGRIDSVHCLVTFPALPCTATVAGTVNATYTDPTAGTAASLRVLAAGQSLTVSQSTCPAQVLPNGTAQFGGTGAGSLGIANLDYVLAGATSTHPALS